MAFKSQGAKPLRIFKETAHLLRSGILKKEPSWYRVVASVPPSAVLVRTVPVDFDSSPPGVLQEKHQQASRKSKKSKRFFQPGHIHYLEDDLRKTFFSDHPWELARPRILVEDDGNDSRRYDWCKLQQPGRALDGESVIRRQMWLMENEGLFKKAAYDLARREFYRLRMRSDIERRIAIEEARSVGAFFGKTHLQVGLELEGRVLAAWRIKAQEAVARKQQRIEAIVGPNNASPDDDIVDEEATLPLDIAASTAESLGKAKD
ncbi:hypothetical protein ABW20_dc0105908 [Dactylellina cionopaga]|nr:hypothetical protein ABW20_dc0105908 [Dactylellina cionopaga]